MKGLILKDLYILKGFVKQFGVIFAFLLVWSFFIKSAYFIVFYFVFMGGSLVISTMSYDEAVSFNRFALTTPVSVRAMIREKYILFLITIGGSAMISILMNLLLCLFPGKDQYFDWEGIWGVVTVMIWAQAAIFPVMYKVGIEKAKNIRTLMMLIITGILLGAFFVLQKLGLSFNVKISEGVIKGILLVITVLALVISYWVSVKVAENKEW